MWHNLPVELQRHCLQSCDVETLKSFRTVDRSTSILATELLFGVLSLQPSEESAKRFIQIVEEDKLRALVRIVVYNTSDDPNVHVDHREWGEKPLESYFKECLWKIGRFSSLREVQIKFDRHCVQDRRYNNRQVAETEEFRRDVLNAVLLSLPHGIREYSLPHFDTLTIRNLQNTPLGFFDSNPSLTLFNHIRKLNLCVITEEDEAAPEDTLRIPETHTFFSTTLFQEWLVPTHEHLTHLTLYATNCPWGFWPACDLRTIHFPSLRYLALGNWTIFDEWQVDWLVSHGSSLEALRLDACPIVIVACMPPAARDKNFPEIQEPCWVNPRMRLSLYLKEIDLRWYDVFPRLGRELPLLKEFAFGKGDWGEGKMFEERDDLGNWLGGDRYCVFHSHDWYGGGEVGKRMRGMGEEGPRKRDILVNKERKAFFYPTCDEQDLKALEELRRVVEGRAKVRV